MIVKPCPICGSMPVPDVTSLEYGGGHGYPECSMMKMVCPHCGLPRARSVNNIDDKSDLLPRATQAWNNEVDRIEKFLEEK